MDEQIRQRLIRRAWLSILGTLVMKNKPIKPAEGQFPGCDEVFSAHDMTVARTPRNGLSPVFQIASGDTIIATATAEGGLVMAPGHQESELVRLLKSVTRKMHIRGIQVHENPKDEDVSPVVGRWRDVKP